MTTVKRSSARTISRRSFLTHAAAIGIVAPAGGALLSACNGPSSAVNRPDTGATAVATVMATPATNTIDEISRHPTQLPHSTNWTRYQNGQYLDEVERTGPIHHEVHVQIQEGIAEVVPGTSLNYWTFDGTVPGPMLRARVGDTMDYFLHNPKSSTMPHDTDFHAVTGPGGGAVNLDVLPGATSELKVKFLKAGIYLYHCAFPPIPVHIAHGMYGLIVIEPEQGLPAVNHEYYLMQSEFYTTKGGDQNYQALEQAGLLDFSIENGRLEQPTFVVYNGRPESVSGGRAIGVYGAEKIKTGDKVRLFFGNIGPNLISSFHTIGAIFDTVYVAGSFAMQNHDVQTTLIPSGGAVAVEITFEVPGDYTITDHSVFRSDKGCTGTIHVEGAARPDIYDPITQSTGLRG